MDTHLLSKINFKLVYNIWGNESANKVLLKVFTNGQIHNGDCYW